VSSIIATQAEGFNSTSATKAEMSTFGAAIHAERFDSVIATQAEVPEQSELDIKEIEQNVEKALQLFMESTGIRKDEISWLFLDMASVGDIFSARNVKGGIAALLARKYVSRRINSLNGDKLQETRELVPYYESYPNRNSRQSDENMIVRTLEQVINSGVSR
jgi:hypothetical protein